MNFFFQSFCSKGLLGKGKIINHCGYHFPSMFLIKIKSFKSSKSFHHYILNLKEEKIMLEKDDPEFKLGKDAVKIEKVASPIASRRPRR